MITGRRSGIYILYLGNLCGEIFCFGATRDEEFSSACSYVAQVGGIVKGYERSLEMRYSYEGDPLWQLFFQQFFLGESARLAMLVFGILGAAFLLKRFASARRLSITGTGFLIVSGLIFAGSKVYSNPSLRDLESRVKTLELLVRTRTDSAGQTLIAPADSFPEVHLSSARAVAYFRSGLFVGYRLLSIAPDSPLQSRGLRHGDIVTEVDGVTPLNLSQFVESVRALENNDGQSYYIWVERGKEPIGLHGKVNTGETEPN